MQRMYGKRVVCVRKFIDPDFPDLIREWDHTKNGLNPRSISTGSGKTVWWVCCLGHSWSGIVRDRIRSRGLCPYCSNKRVLIGHNDLWTTHPTIASRLLIPDEGYKHTYGSKGSLWFRCELQHRWVSVLKDVVSYDSGCPFCTNRKVLIGYNDLWTTNPDLCLELLDQDVGHYVTFGSSITTTWVCKSNHYWDSSVKHRAVSGSGCPRCSNQVSKPEKYLERMLDGFDIECSVQYKIEGVLGKVDLYIPKYNLVIEYDGAFFHHKRFKEDIAKTNLLLSLGFKVLRLREQSTNLLDSLPINSSDFLQIDLQYCRYMSHIDDKLIKIILDWVE